MTTKRTPAIGGKLRSDSKLGTLTPEQRAKVEQWLFEENQSYQRIVERCQEEFGLSLEASSVKRYYAREQPRWELERKAAARLRSEVPAGPVPDAEASYGQLLDKMIQIALEMAGGSRTPEECRQVCAYARVVITARRESNESLRAATTRERFEFDAAAACLIHLVKLRSIAEDAGLDDGQRLLQIREQLFGPNLPA